MAGSGADLLPIILPAGLHFLSEKVPETIEIFRASLKGHKRRHRRILDRVTCFPLLLTLLALILYDVTQGHSNTMLTEWTLFVVLLLGIFAALLTLAPPIRPRSSRRQRIEVAIAKATVNSSSIFMACYGICLLTRGGHGH